MKDIDNKKYGIVSYSMTNIQIVCVLFNIIFLLDSLRDACKNFSVVLLPWLLLTAGFSIVGGSLCLAMSNFLVMTKNTRSWLILNLQDWKVGTCRNNCFSRYNKRHWRPLPLVLDAKTHIYLVSSSKEIHIWFSNFFNNFMKKTQIDFPLSSILQYSRLIVCLNIDCSMCICCWNLQLVLVQISHILQAIVLQIWDFRPPIFLT